MENLNETARLPRVSGLNWDGVNYFSTVRHGGVSAGAYASLNLGLHTNDAPGHVARNRRRLGQELPGEPLWLNQVHGIHVVDADLCGVGSAVPTADAAVTTQTNRVLAIMTADCLPVVIADTDGRALGVAHAGWRGLQKGVLEAMLEHLRAKRPEATQWRAWIGPAISQRYFEVGADVFSAFVDQDAQTALFFVEKTARQKWLADLPGLARHRLHKAGVANIELSGCCTYGDAAQFYSYRRASDTGRLATLAWLEPGATTA